MFTRIRAACARSGRASPLRSFAASVRVLATDKGEALPSVSRSSCGAVTQAPYITSIGSNPATSARAASTAVIEPADAPAIASIRSAPGLRSVTACTPASSAASAPPSYAPSAIAPEIVRPTLTSPLAPVTGRG